jgi:hypothetical protein
LNGGLASTTDGELSGTTDAYYAPSHLLVRRILKKAQDEGVSGGALSSVRATTQVWARNPINRLLASQAWFNFLHDTNHAHRERVYLFRKKVLAYFETLKIPFFF